MLYEDDAVVVLNKRAKLLAVPADDSDTPSALSILSAELKSKRQRAFVVHRIDRHTSGILLFAKTWPDREAYFFSSVLCPLALRATAVLPLKNLSIA